MHIRCYVYTYTYIMFPGNKRLPKLTQGHSIVNTRKEA